jgi:hypothetical protein
MSRLNMLLDRVALPDPGVLVRADGRSQRIQKKKKE